MDPPMVVYLDVGDAAPFIVMLVVLVAVWLAVVWFKNREQRAYDRLRSRPLDPGRVDRLIAEFRDKHGSLERRRRYALRLAEGPMKAVDGLMVALKDDEDDWTRMISAVALGESGHGRAVEPLLDALNDSSPRVRAAAVPALGKVRREGSDRRILEALQRTFDSELANPARSCSILNRIARLMKELDPARAAGLLVRCAVVQKWSSDLEDVRSMLLALLERQATDVTCEGLQAIASLPEKKVSLVGYRTVETVDVDAGPWYESDVRATAGSGSVTVPDFEAVFFRDVIEMAQKELARRAQSAR